MEKEIIALCACGCGAIHLSQFEDEDDTVYFGHYTASWYALQQPGWNDLKDRLRMIWKIIIGKRFCFYDVVLQGNELAKFLEFCKDIPVPEQK